MEDVAINSVLLPRDELNTMRLVGRAKSSVKPTFQNPLAKDVLCKPLKLMSNGSWLV